MTVRSASLSSTGIATLRAAIVTLRTVIVTLLTGIIDVFAMTALPNPSTGVVFPVVSVLRNSPPMTRPRWAGWTPTSSLKSHSKPPRSGLLAHRIHTARRLPRVLNHLGEPRFVSSESGLAPFGSSQFVSLREVIATSFLIAQAGFPLAERAGYIARDADRADHDFATCL